MTEADRATLSKHLGNADVRLISDASPGTLEVECRVGVHRHTVGIRSEHDIFTPGPARTEALEMIACAFLDRAPDLFPVA
jgi:hypothetical protein